MDYCKNCGKQIEPGAEFCASCGAKLHQNGIVYRKQSGSGVTAGKVIAIFFGGLLILVGVPILFAGTALLAVTSTLDTGNGYMGIEGVDFDTSSYAIVFREMHVEDVVIEKFEGPVSRFWFPEPSDFVDIRLKARSNNGKNVFIGIIEESKASQYLGNAQYSRVTDFVLKNPDNNNPYITYTLHPGGNVTTSPIDLDIWDAYAYGEDLVLDWAPESGDYWVVIMNTDASPYVDVETGIGIKVPFLNVISMGLLSGGLICFGLGALIIYLGFFRQYD